jgi:23S rRNA G2445 N2-methylase RlmL
MLDNNTKRKIVIQCSPLISSITAKEVEKLSIPVKKVEKLHLELEGNMHDCIYLNLKLRTANRVLLHLFNCEATNADDLYREVKKYPWEEIIKIKGYFNIQSKVNNPTIKDNRFASLRFKDAIADRFNQLFQKRPNSGSDRNKIVLFFYWQNDNCQVYLDTSGETIAKHGYRKIPMIAPMQESLASAVLYSTNWDKETPLVNPMCGSGTLAIEAAMMAAGIAPGLLRNNYSFMHVPNFSKYQFEEIKMKAQPPSAVKIPSIIATDIDQQAIEAAKKNAALAGVINYIKFQVADFRKTRLPKDKGIVILNPEYGERLGEEKNLEETYAAIGDFFKKNCTGYTGYIFTGNLQLAKKVGLKTSRKLEFYNGKIDSRLLEYPIF